MSEKYHVFILHVLVPASSSFLSARRNKYIYEGKISYNITNYKVGKPFYLFFLSMLASKKNRKKKYTIALFDASYWGTRSCHIEHFFLNKKAVYVENSSEDRLEDYNKRPKKGMSEEHSPNTNQAFSSCL